jgi:N-dimethylarginine dimethylaminohydrolase
MPSKILMCPPDYFSIDYAINPWMKQGSGCDLEKTKKEWNDLKNIFANRLRTEVVTMEPQPGLPDIVFTANAALFHNNIAVISRFRYQERRPEEKFYAEWFRNNGYMVTFLPEDICFEGAGDALFSGDTLYAGYIPRTDIRAHTFIANLLNIRVLSLELTDERFYHLDTCFCPLEGGYLIYFPEAFDDYGNRVIESNFSSEKRIPVTNEEACKFSCNAVNIGKAVVMNFTTDRLKNELRQKGFKVFETDLSEFIKAGGSAKCLTLKLRNQAKTSS